jgi:hypothetical protein
MSWGGRLPDNELDKRTSLIAKIFRLKNTEARQACAAHEDETELVIN